MANKKRLIIIGGVAALAFLAIKKVNAAKKSFELLEYDIADVAVKFPSLTKAIVEVKVNVFNPGQIAIPVKSFYGNITYKGTTLGSFKDSGGVNVSKQSKGQFIVQAEVSSLYIVANIIKAIANKTKGFTIDFNGNFNTGLFQQPFKESYTF